jgi:hypothetical protein
MVQTRAEAAGLVLQLQRVAVTQGLLFYAIAAVTGLSFMTAVIVWIAVAAPPSWRGWALGIVALALLGTAIFAVVTAGRHLKRDAGLIADYSKGLRLDLAMINLALKDPDADDEEKLAERERARQKVREAAADKAAAPGTAEGGKGPAPEGAAARSADAAVRAAASPPDTAGPADVAPGPAGAAHAPTGGGTYASSSQSPATTDATEREMPGEAVRAEDVDATLDERATNPRESHGRA